MDSVSGIVKRIISVRATAPRLRRAVITLHKHIEIAHASRRDVALVSRHEELCTSDSHHKGRSCQKGRSLARCDTIGHHARCSSLDRGDP